MNSDELSDFAVDIPTFLRMGDVKRFEGVAVIVAISKSVVGIFNNCNVPGIWIPRGEGELMMPLEGT